MAVAALTLNPAIDRTYYSNSFCVDNVNRAEKVLVNPGGKGINFIRAVSRGGIDCIASGFLGKGAENILRAVSNDGIKTDFISVQSDIRVNVKICDLKNGTYTDLNEAGAPVSKFEFNLMLEKVRELSKVCRYLYLGGSLPNGLSDDAYEKIIEICKENNIKAILDTSGEPLKKGVLAKPDILKPNLAEAQELLGKEILSFSDAALAAQEIQNLGVSTVLLTMGNKGCIAATNKGVYAVQALDVKTKSTVGAGDVFLAGYVYGLCMGMDMEDSLKYAVSFATAKVQSEGNSIPAFESLIENKDKIICRKIGG